MQIITQPGLIDMRSSMYPSTANLIIDLENFSQPAWSTVYGIVLDGLVTLPNGKTANKLEYFCVTNRTEQSQIINCQGCVAIFTRIGFIGQDLIGGPIESTGRLSYIDGCSDSILVYPPRLGDPSLNLLAFPKGIDQSFHLHPSIRLGIVIEGHGHSTLNDKEYNLTAGSVFCLEPQEIHRFRTVESEMKIVIFHPDGNWGPTDHDHVMINRTYLHK